jgi:hypothetical protein
MQKFIYLILFISFTLPLSSQNFWKQLDNSTLSQFRNSEEIVLPQEFSTFVLDAKGLQSFLTDAPNEFGSGADLMVDIPMPEGNLKRFTISYSPVMQEGLAKKYPGIRSFKGYALDDKKMNIRFDIGPKGLRASIHGDLNIYIDPVSDQVPDTYMVYYTRDYKEDVSSYNLTCGLDPYDILEEDLEDEQGPAPIDFPGKELDLRSQSECDSVPLYTYRLALSCTGEWGKTHGNSIETALADMVTAVNRINQIYENEFSIRLLLIDNNDQIIWLDKDTDPFPVANSGFELLGVNTIVLNNNVGINSYDIGHVLTNSCTDVGGVASLGSVCSNIRKGSAVTCQYSSNLNYIVTNVMAHEMGHQFSAQHTFNNCNGNESAGNDFEPGGGTTIMAYCGLCGSNNVDYNCLENFHSHSVEQVRNFTRVGGGHNCAAVLSTGNTAPVVELDYKDGFKIPIGTPFILEGSAYDCEGDELSYSWEEWDLGPISAPIGEPFDDTPIFTAQEPKDTPVRVFPAMNKIINNIQNNSELLPTYTRAMKFRLTARDNNENGGGTGWANVSFKADDSAGPFYVVYPNQIETTTIGDSMEIKWNVANTDNDIINCQNVNIWLSIDAGYNYTKLLKYNTPNDGSENIFIPNLPTSLGRIKVEAADNIFFDISNNYLKIVAPDEPAYSMEVTPLYQQICLPDIVSINISTASFNGYADTLRFETGAGIPEGAKVEFIPETAMPGENVALQIYFSEVNKRDSYTIDILSISSAGDTLVRQIDLNIITNDYSDLQIIQPAPGASGNGQLVDLIWTKSQSANSYNIYLSDNPTFPEASTLIKLNTLDTIYSPQNTLKKSTVYYWKIEGNNECGNLDASEILTFSTEAFACKTLISGDLPQDIRSNMTTSTIITIEEETDVADVNISRIAGDHDNFADLDAFLMGPDGTTVTLFSSKCYGYNGFDFDFGMDDESTYKFKCPPYGGVYYPLGSLSDFVGKSAKGDWTLQISDVTSPKGGELSDFELEICANSVLSNPYLVNNNPYLVAIGIAWDLPSSKLKAEDEDNTPEELTYTLVDMPMMASILLDGNYISTGDTFTETDVRSGKLQLLSTGSHEMEDSFSFVITDGNGGWLEKTRFNFTHDAFVQANSISLFEKIELFPNPTNEISYIQIYESGRYELNIFDMNGKKIMSNALNGFEKKQLDLSALASGVYYIQIGNQQNQAIKKLVKQ